MLDFLPFQLKKEIQFFLCLFYETVLLRYFITNPMIDWKQFLEVAESTLNSICAKI